MIEDIEEPLRHAVAGKQILVACHDCRRANDYWRAAMDVYHHEAPRDDHTTRAIWFTSGGMIQFTSVDADPMRFRGSRQLVDLAPGYSNHKPLHALREWDILRDIQESRYA